MPRLLIVKMGAIGDVIMALPAAEAMHRAGYEVDWLAGRAVVPLLRLFPWINIIEVDDAAILRGSAPTRIRTIVGLWRRLLGRRYDVVATLYYDSRYKLLTAPIRATRKFQLSLVQREFRMLPGRHHTSEYARMLLAGLPASVRDGESPHQAAPLQLSGLLPPSPLPPPHHAKQRIVLVPAGARNTLRDDALRRWPIESYVELTRQLLARGFEVVLSGGPDDAWASEHFAGLPVVDGIAKFSLLDSIALLDSADVVVSHDTGPLHMAGSTRAAVVAIFGPTDPHNVCPQRNNVVALWGGEGFACRPCYDGRDYAACDHRGCLYQITPTMVLGEIDTLLTARREGRELPPRTRVPRHTAVLPIQISPAKQVPHA